MVGAGETYVPAFVLALGLGGIAAGMVVTVPVLLGALLQLVSPWAVNRLGSRRRWVVACARAQAASLLLLALLAASGLRAAWPIYLCATLYWAGGQAGGPAWNTWVESLVPKRIRARFFAGRVRISQACTMVGLVTAGVFLNARGSDASTAIFAIPFAAAAVARLLSASCLASQTEPADANDRAADVGLLTTLRGLGNNAHSGLLGYLLAVQVAVCMSGPYFAPYMLSKLHLSYLPFVTLIGLAFVGKVLALPAWGRFAKRFGVRRLLWAGGLGIIPIAALWSLSDNVYYLAGLQVISGVVWAAYELAMFLVFFDGLPKPQRTSLLTVYNVGNALAMVVGSALGAAWLAWFDQSKGAYLLLFAISSLCRLGTLSLLARVPEGAGQHTAMATRTVSVRPSAGTIEQPILATLER